MRDLGPIRWVIERVAGGSKILMDIDDSAGGQGRRRSRRPPVFLDGPLWVVVTHRLEDAPDPETGFKFIDSLDAALEEATAAADGKDIAISGGGDVIRQALAAGHVDVLAISTAPVILGRGKGLFDGFDYDIDLEIRSVHSSPYTTHTTYTVKDRHDGQGRPQSS